MSRLRDRSGQTLGQAVDICRVQDAGFRREFVRMIKRKTTRFKLFLKGNDWGIRGAGIFLGEKRIDKKIDISSVSDRMIFIKGYLRWKKFFFAALPPLMYELCFFI